MKIVDLKNEMDARFAAVDDRFGAVDARFDRVEHAIATGFETLRRHMEILFEQSRADFRLGLERIDAQQHQIDALLSSNTHEHSAFVEILQDHEGRIKTLERPARSPKTPRTR
jgi:hypothetical protein